MRWLPSILCVLLVGCTKAEPALGTRAFTVTWKDEVAEPLSVECAACHGATADGGYRVDSYLAAIGATVAGDPTSRLLTILDPATAQPPHAGHVELHALLVTWVVDDALAYEQSEVHGGGIQNPASSEFHGQVLARGGWNFPLCQKCHGDDFGGGITGVTCLSCHAAGPTSCTTCHGDSPVSGAHAVHVLGGPLLGKRYACSECHVQPATWDAPGHIRNADGTAITTPVKVVFGALAGASPTFDGTSCTNVYCHDPFGPDSNATMQSPSWSSSTPATCSSCHGQPPAAHPAGACVNCHSAVIDAAGSIVDTTLHIAGKATLGDGDGTCMACHPTATLDGAHTSHLQGTNKIASPIACTECHVVPSSVSSPGHFTADGLAAVFPPGGTGPLANADGAVPAYAALQCSGTYCHGSGTLLTKDTSVEIIRDPIWQPGSGAGRCGTCHGLPPLDGVHDPAWQITICSQCHAKSVDAFGQILFTNGTSTHLNGVVDAP